MDFCRINESVPCDEVWYHVDTKVFSYDMVTNSICSIYFFIIIIIFLPVVLCYRWCSSRSYGDGASSADGGDLLLMSLYKTSFLLPLQKMLLSQ